MAANKGDLQTQIGVEQIQDAVQDAVPSNDATPNRGQHAAASITQHFDIFDVSDGPFRWAEPLKNYARADDEIDDGAGTYLVELGGGPKSHGCTQRALSSCRRQWR